MAELGFSGAWTPPPQEPPGFPRSSCKPGRAWRTGKASAYPGQGRGAPTAWASAPPPPFLSCPCPFPPRLGPQRPQQAPFIHNLPAPLGERGKLLGRQDGGAGPWPAQLPCPPPPPQAPPALLPFLYGRQSANSQPRGVGQRRWPRGETVYSLRRFLAPAVRQAGLAVTCLFSRPTAGPGSWQVRAEGSW